MADRKALTRRSRAGRREPLIDSRHVGHVHPPAEVAQLLASSQRKLRNARFASRDVSGRSVMTVDAPDRDRQLPLPADDIGAFAEVIQAIDDDVAAVERDRGQTVDVRDAEGSTKVSVARAVEDVDLLIHLKDDVGEVVPDASSTDAGGILEARVVCHPKFAELVDIRVPAA